MSTQVMDQVASEASLSTDQQARTAAFAAREQLHAGEAVTAPVWYSGTGTITDAVAISDNGGGFAQVGWNVSSSLGVYCTQQFDWIGVFTNKNQALVNPNSNYLGGAKGWAWASSGGPFTTDVALQAGMVAAYVIKNAAGNYVTVAVSPPFPG